MCAKRHTYVMVIKMLHVPGYVWKEKSIICILEKFVISLHLTSAMLKLASLAMYTILCESISDLSKNKIKYYLIFFLTGVRNTPLGLLTKENDNTTWINDFSSWWLLLLGYMSFEPTVYQKMPL